MPTPETERRVDYVPLDDLTANPANPKEHDESVIGASMGRFGFMEPVVIDGRTGYLVSGHGRTKTLRQRFEAGDDPPEGVRVLPDGSWQVPAVTGWSSADDFEAEAALVALNRTTELGGWSDESLLDLLDDLSGSDVGLDGIGFSEDDLDDLRASLEELGAPTPSTDWKDSDTGLKEGEKSYDEFLERYANKAVRSILLDYNLPVYTWVVAQLDVLRGVGESNAAVVLGLISDAVGEEPPSADQEEAVTP